MEQKGNCDYDDVRKRSIALYTSACASIGKKHELSPIDDFIYEGQPYEDLRSILLGTTETLTDAHLSLLLPEDQQYCTTGQNNAKDKTPKASLMCLWRFVLY